MIKYHSNILAGVILLTMLLCVSTYAANLLVNPGWATEGASADRAQGWEDNVTGGVWGNSERSDWNNHDGDGYSDLIKGSWGGSDYGGSWQKVSVVGGEQYEISAWFFVDNGWSASTWELKIEWYANGSFISDDILNISGVAQSTWEQKMLSAQAPANADSANLVLNVGGIGSDGAMYMDDLDLHQIAAPSGWGIQNGGIEDQGSVDTDAAVWGEWGSAARRSWNKHAGTWSMGLQPTWSGFDYGGCWQALPVTSGVPYTVTGFFLRDGGWSASSVELKLEWYDSSESYLGEAVLDLGGLPAWSWEEKILEATAPAGAASVHVVLNASGIGASDMFYMDDLSISAGEIPPVGSTTLNVDLAMNRKSISKYIYGLNIANWSAGYYLDLCAPKVKDAGFTVMRYGATNIERYNYENNRLYNVISRLNQYVPTSWESFTDWCIDEVEAEPLIQISVFGHVAGEGWGLGDPTYDHVQTSAEVFDWIADAGSYVKFWGIGNEPMISWKRHDYPGHFADSAHGDQVLNQDVSYDTYFPRFAELANAIKNANPDAKILGPTPANWWLYWSSDYSPYCPVTTAGGPALPDDPGWQTMLATENQWDASVFPSRGGDPAVTGWETDTNRFLPQYASRMAVAEQQYGKRLADFMDVHRYMNCWNDRDAINEPRGLHEIGFASHDQETGNSGTETKILRRFQDIVTQHYPGTELSLSEYDFFYWNGYPSIPQVAAIGQMEYLGIFAEMGVQLACNWYLGEPDQSGGAFEHASDSAKQAMFNEKGEPNPKYWVIWMMRRLFDDTVVEASSSDNDQFSVHACHRTNDSEVVVFVANKGEYDEEGALLATQFARDAEIVVTNSTITSVKKILRFGHHDPYPVEMDLAGLNFADNKLTYSCAPLAIYAFVFSTIGEVEAPATYLHVTPASVDFGPYETGSEVHGSETTYTMPIKISNARNGGTTWSVSENAPWLSVVNTSGDADVTDRAYLVANKAGLSYGVHSTIVTVTTSEGNVDVPVSVDVVPGEADGEKRICDFDTDSLAHAWSKQEPYSLGWWDFHGNPGDRDAPYIYNLSLDLEEKSRLGGLASMKVVYDRSNGDLSDGKLYAAFGTYGHTTVAVDHEGGNDETNSACADWTGYDTLLIDIRTKTDILGPSKSQFLLVIKDEDGNAGKPEHSSMASYKDQIEVIDGGWQTIAIPLNGTFFDWRYPEGQDGSSVQMNFAKISQIEFVPWAAHDDKSGTIWIDNIRLVTADSSGNKRPTAIATQNKELVYPGETVALTGSGSWDDDGTIASYRWEPATGLSDANVADPTFSLTTSGTHEYELIVTDNQGVESRNIAQVSITVLSELTGQAVTLYRDAELTDSNVGNDSLEVYVKLTCTSGGNPDEVDFTLCTVSSSDTYSGDPNNACGDIEIILVETGIDTKIYTGMIKVGAFSDDTADRIGCSDGFDVTVTASDGVASDSFTLGWQEYGLWRWIDRVETDLWQPNHFEGYPAAYNDHKYTNTTEAYVNYVVGGTPHADSTKCLKGDITLHLGAAQDTYRLFGGIACTMNPFDEDITNLEANVDLRPSTTWTKGISFWLKGNGNMLSVVVKSETITDYDDYVFTMEHTPTDWRRFFIPLSEFKQEGWGTAVAFNDAMEQVEAIQFKAASKTDGEYSQFFVDDVAVFGGCIDVVDPLVHWSDSTNTFENDLRSGSYGWDTWGTGFGFGLYTGMPYFEGNSSFLVNLDTGAEGYWLGALVPKITNLPYAAPNTTNWDAGDGVAVKLWRRDDILDTEPYPTLPTPDGSPMRVRMVVSEDTGADFTDVGVTRWFSVDSTYADSDYILFPKETFYTESTVNLVPSTNGVIPWVEWSGDWSNINKFRIDFGGNSETARPYWIYLDDLQIYEDNGAIYPCPWE